MAKTLVYDAHIYIAKVPDLQHDAGNWNFYMYCSFIYMLSNYLVSNFQSIAEFVQEGTKPFADLKAILMVYIAECEDNIGVHVHKIMQEY